jgi:O-antigen/teichoic acid export membrane protein
VPLVLNFLLLSGGEVLSKVLTFVAIAYAARMVGPMGFGYLEFAWASVLIAGLFVHQGLGLYGTREIARKPDDTDRIVSEILSLRCMMAGAAYLGLIIWLLWLDRPPEVERLVMIYGTALLFMPFAMPWVFQGHERMNVAAGLQVTRQFVFAATVVLFLRSPDGLWAVAAAEVAGIAAAAAASVWMYRRTFGRRMPGPGRVSVETLKGGSMIATGRILWSVRLSGSVVVFGVIATPEDLGFFGASMRILVGLYVFIWLYYVNLLPSLTRDWSRGSGLEDRVRTSMRLVGWLAPVAGALWVLLAPLAIRVVYGSAFAPAVAALQVMAGVCVVAAIHGHYRYALIAAGRHRDEMITSGMGTLAALPLIPIGYAQWGLMGAAGALVVGECAIWVSAWWFTRGHVPLGWLGVHLVLPSMVIGGLMWIVTRLPPNSVRLAAAVAIVVVGATVAAVATQPEARQALARLIRDKPADLHS